MDANFINEFVFNVANKGVITYSLKDTTNSGIPASTRDFISSRLQWIEQLIPVKFQEVSDGALLEIIKADTAEGAPWYTDGLSRTTNTNLYVYYKNDPTPESTRSQFALIHELGHALGLTHPFEDPFNQQYNNDITIMSGWTSSPSNSWRTNLSAFDFQNLQSVWGTVDPITGLKNGKLKGTPEADVIVGSSGDDWISGRDGADWITGGSGSDTFVLKRYRSVNVFNYDLIEDYTKNDSIQITGQFKKEFVKVDSYLSDSWISYKGEILVYFPDVSDKLIKESLADSFNG